MNQNISLQIFDELGKAFDWHQISDFNCHGTKYLFSVDIKYFSQLVSAILSLPPLHPVLLHTLFWPRWVSSFDLFLTQKNIFFLDPNVTRLLSHSLALLTSYPIIMISNMVNFQVLILFSISPVTKFAFEIEFLISQVLTVFAAVAAYAVPSNDFKINCCSD